MIRIAARILIRFLTLPIAVFILLVSGQWSVVSSPVQAAQAQPPAPAPCTNAKTTNYLTDNYVTTEEGEAPSGVIPTGDQTGIPGQPVNILVSASFQVDFSKLQAIFGPSNSDYQDGKTQDQARQSANLVNLEDQDLNQFNGPIQKITPVSKLDSDKVKFVEYVAANPHLLESDDKYTDKEGQFPKTVFELVTEYGFPQPPKASDDETVKADWNEKWGRYWAKIPTAYREFYKGFVDFRAYGGDKTFSQLKNGVVGECPSPTVLRSVQFVMPEFSRTLGTSDQLNNIVVPCSAQSFKHGTGVNGDECGNTQKAAFNTNEEKGNIFSKTLNFCKKLATKLPKQVAAKFKKTVKISLNFLNPVKPALAVDPAPTPVPCFKIMTEGKEGNAPFCAVPTNKTDDQNNPTEINVQPGECTNPNPGDPNNLNKGQNVVCTFIVTNNVTLNIPTDLTADNPQWDSCDPPNPDGTITCRSTIRIFPVIRIPFLAEIWNSTYYSDESEKGIEGSPQKSGRPGIYTNFMPQAVSETLFGEGMDREKLLELQKQCNLAGQNWQDSEACQELLDYLQELIDKYEGTQQANEAAECLDVEIIKPFPTFDKCFGSLFSKIPSRSLPGQVADNVQGAKDSNVLGVNDSGEKERFIGATDCSKSFTKDIALKPKALQEHIGITKQDCEMNAASNAGGSQPGGPPSGGDDGPPVDIPPDCSNISGDNPSTPNRETSRDELVCYIVSLAGTQIEQATGDPLSVVMIKIMDAESSGNQCAKGSYGEIGVFQYIAGTWKGGTIAPQVGNLDSGSVQTSGCWQIPGPDPVSTASGDSIFSWPAQFGGTNDGGAWNPFWQIQNTVTKILNDGSPCAWSTIDYIDPTTGERKGLYPFLCIR